MHDGKQMVRFSQEELVELVERMRAGCEDSYAWLYTQVWALSLHESTRYGGRDNHVGFDVRIPRILERFDPAEGTLAGFVGQAYRNFDHRRHLVDTKRSIQLDYAHRQDDFQSVGRDEGFIDDEWAAKRLDALKRCQRHLNNFDKHLLKQYYKDGLTLHELGAIHKCSHQTVKNRLSDIYARLKKKMAAEFK